jgi:hypothetical protein
MAQHDFNIANATFPTVRSDINSALTAINTSQSGTSRPSSAVAGTIWLDTTSATTPTLKYYDGADDISLATLDHTANTVNWLDSSVSITGLSTTATGTVLTLSDSANTSTVNLIIDNDKEIRFREATANGTNYISLSAPASLSADVTYTLPVAPTVNNQALISSTAGAMSFTPYAFPSSDGTANQFLKTNGSGTLSFSSGGGFSGATENAISASALTLTSASTQYQKVQISSLANSSVTLPDATTLSTEGSPVFVIENNSPIGASLDVKNNSGTVIGVIPDNSISIISLVDNTTSAGVYEIGNTVQSVGDISTTVNSNTATATSLTKVIHLTATKLLVANFHFATTGALTLYTKIGDLSGSTITFGSQQTSTLASAASSGTCFFRGDIVRLSDSAFILMWGRGTDDQAGAFTSIRRISANTVSGTTITFGTANALSFPAGTTDQNQVKAVAFNGQCCRMSDTKFAVVYNTTAVASATQWNTAYSGSLTCNIITVSGTTLTVGTKVDLGTSTFTQPTTLVCHDTDRLCVVYYQNTSATNGTGRNKMNIISVSTTTPTWGTSVNVEASDIENVWSNLGNSFGGQNPVGVANNPSTSLNNMYGVALSTTSVFGVCGGATGNILVGISGTTPSVTFTKLLKETNATAILYPPIPLSSTVLYIPSIIGSYGGLVYTSASGFKLSSALSLTTNSPTYMTNSALRATSASTNVTFFNNSLSGVTYIATATITL